MSASALVVAVLGSTPLGHALVSNVPRNSVGPIHLKRNAVGPQKIAPNAVRAPHVLNGSLLAEDFKAGQIPAGPAGPKGDPGAPGVAERQVVAQGGEVDSSTSKSAVATCPPGKVALGGGGTLVGSGPIALFASRPNGETGWRVSAHEVVAFAPNWNLIAYVVCAKVT
jgi:hypothetical protein